MKVDELKSELRDLLKQPLREEGAEIVDLVVSRYKSSSTVRLFVYSDRGTSIDECARLSRVVGDLIDRTDHFENGYTLEVSSPGLDRPLTTVLDFRHRTGETVRVQFVDKARKKITAEVVGVSDNTVQFKNEDGEFSVHMDEIESAKIVF